MEQSDYTAAFHRYEHARERYAGLQQEIREFLAQFTGEAPLEQGFVLRDLARMEGLRYERDQAYDTFTRLEKEIFERLGQPWDMGKGDLEQT